MKKNMMYEKRNAWGEYNGKEMKAVMKYASEYSDFIDYAKTERFSVEYLKNMAKGFSAGKAKKKFIMENVNKNLALISMGSISPLKGIKIVGSHIDVPRIDIKGNPLYEKFSIAQMKTHYYGGIRKYHWLNRPLGIFGVIFTGNGKRIDVRIGEKKDDPVFVIGDLLPHLSRSQSKKTVIEAFEGEKLNIIVGSIPLKKTQKRAIASNVMKILNEKYHIVEEDFISAELEIVPVEKARDVGFDRGMLAAYGHDDRVCAYTSATALMKGKNKRTAVALMYDKEETGSNGKTGAQGKFIEDIVIEILKRAKIEPTYANIRTVMNNSELLSSDVSAGINPDYSHVHEEKNAAIMGHGVVVTKFTGSWGKSGANDANAEFVFKIRQIFNKAKVVWQSAELGKVDEGGGGTIAKYMAQYGIEVIDCGPALLSMHSPFEIVSKADLYETYKAYRAFFESN